MGEALGTAEMAGIMTRLGTTAKRAAIGQAFQGVIVSERVAKTFESLKLGNIAIAKIQVLDETPEQSLRQRLLEVEPKKDMEPKKTEKGQA